MGYVDMVFSSSLDIIKKKKNCRPFLCGPSLTASKNVRRAFIGFVKKKLAVFQVKKKERRLNLNFLRKEYPLIKKNMLKSKSRVL